MLMLSIHSMVPVFATEEEDFIRPVDIQIDHYGSGGSCVTLGRVLATQVDAGEVVNAGCSLKDVCDSESTPLFNAYCAIFDDEGEVRDELGLEFAYDHLVMLDRIVLHPCLRSCEHLIVNAIANTFGGVAIVVMMEGEADIPTTTLASIGFRKIAGADRLLVLHTAHVSPASQEASQGAAMASNFEPPADAERWLMEQWGDEEE